MSSAAPPPYVVILAAGEPETGLWCDSCLRPSRVRVPTFMITESGSSDGPAAGMCLQCERRS